MTDETIGSEPGTIGSPVVGVIIIATVKAELNGFGPVVGDLQGGAVEGVALFFAGDPGVAHGQELAAVDPALPGGSLGAGPAILQGYGHGIPGQ